MIPKSGPKIMLQRKTWNDSQLKQSHSVRMHHRRLTMCGRAKLPDDVSEIKLDLKIDFDEIGDYHPRWNAAPTSKLPVVVSKTGTRILTLMRWGLIPSWAKDLKIRPQRIKVRMRVPVLETTTGSFEV